MVNNIKKIIIQYRIIEVCGSVYYRIIYFDYIFYNNPDFFRIVVDYYMAYKFFL